MKGDWFVDTSLLFASKLQRFLPINKVLGFSDGCSMPNASACHRVILYALQSVIESVLFWM